MITWTYCRFSNRLHAFHLIHKFIVTGIIVTTIYLPSSYSAQDSGRRPIYPPHPWPEILPKSEVNIELGDRVNWGGVVRQLGQFPRTLHWSAPGILGCCTLYINIHYLEGKGRGRWQFWKIRVRMYNNKNCNFLHPISDLKRCFQGTNDHKKN